MSPGLNTCPRHLSAARVPITRWLRAARRQPARMPALGGLGRRTEDSVAARRRSGSALIGSSSVSSAGAAGLVSAPARPVAVQPSAADAGRADLACAAATRLLARQRRRAACRRYPARGRQLPRLPAAKRFRRLRPLRLLEVAAPLPLGGAARLADRHARAA